MRSYHVRILAGRLDREAGSSNYNRELACRLHARGHHVSLVCFQSVPEVAECAEIVEIPQVNWLGKKFIWRLRPWLQYRHCARALWRQALAPADVAIGAEYFFVKAHCRRFPRTPLIYFPHSLVPALEIAADGWRGLNRWLAEQVYTRVERWALNHADCTVRFTHRACAASLAHYGATVHPRFVVNPPGVDGGRSPSNRLPGSDIRLLFVGRLAPVKGLDLALNALQPLGRYRWRLDVLGDGEQRETLVGQAKELGLAERVHFHGRQHDPTAWYRQADLLLFPSRSESFGLVLAEAMSHGLPCLGFRHDGVNYHNANDEIIDHDRTGLLARDAADFAAQLETAFRRPDRLRGLGQAAFQHAAKHFSWERHLERYERLFERLCEERH